jgi:hypothetical protein
MMVWITNGVVDLGFLPDFLDEDDPRRAKEQLDANYSSGWHPFKDFTFDREKMELKHPGDPPLKAVAFTFLRDEIIMVFPYSWVLILQMDDTFEVARMD